MNNRREEAKAKKLAAMKDVLAKHHNVDDLPTYLMAHLVEVRDMAVKAEMNFFDAHLTPGRHTGGRLFDSPQWGKEVSFAFTYGGDTKRETGVNNNVEMFMLAFDGLEKQTRGILAKRNDVNDFQSLYQIITELVEPLATHPEFEAFISSLSGEEKSQDACRNLILGALGYKLLGLCSYLNTKDLKSHPGMDEAQKFSSREKAIMNGNATKTYDYRLAPQQRLKYSSADKEAAARKVQQVEEGRLNEKEEKRKALNQQRAAMEKDSKNRNKARRSTSTGRISGAISKDKSENRAGLSRSMGGDSGELKQGKASRRGSRSKLTKSLGGAEKEKSIKEPTDEEILKALQEQKKETLRQQEKGSENDGGTDHVSRHTPRK